MAATAMHFQIEKKVAVRTIPSKFDIEKTVSNALLACAHVLQLFGHFIYQLDRSIASEKVSLDLQLQLIGMITMVNGSISS